MKKALLVFCIILSLTMRNSFAQKNTNLNVIIFCNGDTLYSPKIMESKIHTNQDEIAYTDKQNTIQKLAACQIKEYYFNNEYFHSVMIKNDSICRLVAFEVGGYVSFGLSYTSDGDMNFYVKKDEEAVSLEKYRFNLDSFFSAYLENFEQFRKSYKVKISYDFKTLAEMISAYNAYKYPENYVFERAENKEKGCFGVTASGGLMNTTLSGYKADNMTGGSLSFGISLESVYSRRFAIYLPLSYNISSGKGTNMSIYLSTLNFEPYLSFRMLPKKKVNFEIGAGIGLLYSINSYLDCSSLPGSDQDKVKLNKMNFGPNISFMANLDRKLKAQLMYVQYQARSFNLMESSVEDTSVKASSNNFRLMLSYCF